MEWWHALILGLVEGLTEYLPVSSTGHLLIAQRLLGIASSESADAFAICIQSGAILAVVGLYFNRVRHMALGCLGRDPEGLKLSINVVAAFIPAAVIGLLLEKPIKKYLFGGNEFGLWPIVGAWFVGGVAILAVVIWRRSRNVVLKKPRSITDLTIASAVLIGVIQCLAMWPGVSRSLVTIVGGLLVGLGLPAAVEFSFLLGMVTLTAATGYDGLKYGKEMLATFGPAPLAIGLFASWLSAVIAVKWMVSYLNRHGLAIFGYYRIILALVVAALILKGFFPG
ncbi:MAG TPA: undecaprenyl-diphosphate phosphatase [Chthoniobacterales bacterium]|nr:undecaprenyl-diphosphate phosphatase [Chthoniobacterales bacterium]